MPFTLQDAKDLLGQEWEELPGKYTDTDTLLYAVSVGMGRDPLDPQELTYVCESSGKNVLPTVASVLGKPATRPKNNPFATLMTKMNFMMMLHGEQRLEIHQTIPPKAKTLISTGVTGIFDKGEGKGTIIAMETRVKLEDGSPLFTTSSSLFFRADGGFGGSEEGAPVAHPIPDRKPDAVCEMKGQIDQALIYALNGDRNPIHRNPVMAKQAGFERPIIHGLCSYGIACHAVVKTMLDYDQASMTGFDVRFSAPAYPGETQVVEMWKDGNVISFRSTIKERGVVCINNGKCTIK